MSNAGGGRARLQGRRDRRRLGGADRIRTPQRSGCL